MDNGRKEQEMTYQLKDGNLAGLPQHVLRRIAWKMELGDRVLCHMAAEHVHGAKAITARVR